METTLHNILQALTPYLKTSLLAVTIALVMYFLMPLIQKCVKLVRSLRSTRSIVKEYQSKLDAINTRVSVDLPYLVRSIKEGPQEVDEQCFINAIQGYDAVVYVAHQGSVYRVPVEGDREEIVLRAIGAREVRHIGDSSLQELAVLTDDAVCIYDCSGNELVLKEEYCHKGVQHFYADSDFVVTAAFKTVTVHNRKNKTFLEYNLADGVCTSVVCKTLVKGKTMQKYVVAFCGRLLFFFEACTQSVKFQGIEYMMTKDPFYGEHEKGFILGNGFTIGKNFYDVGVTPQKVQYANFNGKESIFFVANGTLYRFFEEWSLGNKTAFGLNIVYEDAEDYIVTGNVIVAVHDRDGILKFIDDRTTVEAA